MSWKNNLMVSAFTFGMKWLEKNVKITAWGSFLNCLYLYYFLLLQQKNVMKTTWGVLDPPVGNTRLSVVRLVASLLQSNTHSINIELVNLNTLGVILVSASFITSVMSNESMWQKEYSSYYITSTEPFVLWALDFKINQMTNVWDTNTNTQGKICCYLNCGHSKLNVIFSLCFLVFFPMTGG